MISVRIVLWGGIWSTTQDGCSLPLCTSPTWPVPSSPVSCVCDWPSCVLAPGPSWWVFLSKEQWGACPSLVPLVTNEPTWYHSHSYWPSLLPVGSERSLLSCPTRRLSFMVGRCSRTLFQTVSSPHPLSHWCLCCWCWALSLILKLGKYRPPRPARCCPILSYLHINSENVNFQPTHSQSGDPLYIPNSAHQRSTWLWSFPSTRCLKICLGFVLIRYGKMTDIEITSLKEELITQSSQEEGACHDMKHHMKKHLGWSGGKEAWGESYGSKFLFRFHGEE